MQLITGCHCGGPGSIPCQSMWNVWWTKWHWDGFLSEYCQCHFTMFHTHLHLNTYQMDKQTKPRNMATRVIPSSMCAVRPAGCVWVVDRVSPHAIDNHVKCVYSDCYSVTAARPALQTERAWKSREEKNLLHDVDGIRFRLPPLIVQSVHYKTVSTIYVIEHKFLH